MLKSMVVILAMFGSVAANAGLVTGAWDAVQDQKAVGAATNPLYYAIQDQKAVGAATNPLYQGAIQDQKAVGAATNPLYQGAVQDQKAVSVESQVETEKLLDLNESF